MFWLGLLTDMIGDGENLRGGMGVGMVGVPAAEKEERSTLCTLNVPESPGEGEEEAGTGEGVPEDDDLEMTRSWLVFGMITLFCPWLEEATVPGGLLRLWIVIA